MMTKNEALAAMANGEKVAHSRFTPDEWVMQRGGDYQFEDDSICTPEEFWHWGTESYWGTGWRIWK